MDWYGDGVRSSVLVICCGGVSPSLRGAILPPFAFPTRRQRVQHSFMVYEKVQRRRCTIRSRLPYPVGL
jgi:hypothetical protein